ncbi:thyrotroph embryonic factor-like [Photinus pyralis]|uniref:thyrotroph embryonic factor-like n=1 Tax=Photinus pyralis TaxID=7054 RepID=UPI00126724FF|nr:thyrotroph embryonic factor-like [Photinus pyralis]
MNFGFTPSPIVSTEPIDCTDSILDLCTRRGPRPPSLAQDPKQTPHSNLKTPFMYNDLSEDSKHSIHLNMKNPLMYTEMPSSTVGVSSPGSETSDISTSSDLYRDVHPSPSYMPKVKIPRPFKAYPKNPLSLTAAECVLNKTSTEAYEEFRKRMLSQVQTGGAGITNKNMRRVPPTNNLHNRNDASYWEKRRKNNEAAKRSRDARRAKEDELAIRAAFLEGENLHLRCELANMRIELEELRSVVYRRPVQA